MSRQQPFQLAVDAETRLDGILHLPDRAGPRPVVVLCHGFKGFMDWGFFPPLGELLTERGFAVVRFNYSGSGQRPGEDRVSDPDAFRRNTHSREVTETLAVIEAVGGAIGGEAIDRSRLGLFGHSRGGGAALLAAADSRLGNPVGALATWAAVGTFDRYDAATKEAWRARGELVVVNGRTGQELPLGLGLLDDIEAHADGGSLDLDAAAGRRAMPWLIVHGTDDEAVAFDHAERLLGAAAAPVILEKLAGAGHTFGARHPWSGPTPHLIAAMNATQSFFLRHLR